MSKQRIGAICKDGTFTTATGRGAGSHHGGVDRWLYKQPTSSSSSTSSSYSYSGLSFYSSSSYGWGGGYSGYSSSSSYSSKSNSNSKSLFGSLWNGIKNILLFLLVIAFIPFYLAYKLLQFLYKILKPLFRFIFEVLIVIIKWIFNGLSKLLRFLFKNPQVILKPLKPVFKCFYVLMSFISTKTTNLIKNQHEKRWPIFKFNKGPEKQQEQVQKENSFEKVILDLKQQIESLQKLRSQIGKDIFELESTTLDLINKKEKQLQIKTKQIEQLKQENDKIQIKLGDQKQKVKILELEKQIYEKKIKSEKQKFRVSLQKVEIKHKEDIAIQKQSYESKILKLKEQQQILKQNLQQKIQKIKQLYSQFVQNKDQEILRFQEDIKTQKTQIEDLKIKIGKIINQHAIQIQVLKQKFNIKKTVNKSDSETQTQQTSNQEKISDLSYPNLLESSLNFSSQPAIIQSSETDLNLTKTRTSFNQSFDSQKQNQSHYQKNNLFSFAASKSKSSQNINLQQNINESNINRSSKEISSKNKQSLQISQNICLTLKNSQNSTNSVNKKKSTNSINHKETDMRNNDQNRVKEENNSYCLKFFISFVILWSIYFFHKLYELLELLNK